MSDTDLIARIKQISYELKLGHVGSCVTAVGIIDGIFAARRKGDKFVLSNGHAGLALYVVLEKYLGVDAAKLFKKHGVHPNRDKYIDASTGSLGHGLGIALGMAIAEPDIDVHCLISDGECAEGSIWEALRIKDHREVINLKVHVNANGWGAYGPIDIYELRYKLNAFDPKIRFHDTEYLMGDKAQSYHYLPPTKDELS